MGRMRPSTKRVSMPKTSNDGRSSTAKAISSIGASHAKRLRKQRRRDSREANVRSQVTRWKTGRRQRRRVVGFGIGKAPPGQGNTKPHLTGLRQGTSASVALCGREQTNEADQDDDKEQVNEIEATFPTTRATRNAAHATPRRYCGGPAYAQR